MAEDKAGVLIVDDERFFREAIRETLSEEGHPCIEAESGEAALRLASDAAVGVVVLDIRLPGIDGIEVLRRLRRERPALRVIMLSASTDQELVLDALRLGACDYLAKPLHDEELVLAVHRAAEAYQVSMDWTQLRDGLDRFLARMDEIALETADLSEPEREERLQQAAADIAADVLEASRTSLMLLSEEGRELYVAASCGHTLDPSQINSVGVGSGVAGLALERAEAIVVGDVAADGRVPAPAPADRYETGSFAVAPLGPPSRPLGVLCVTDRIGGRRFTREDLTLLRLLAWKLADFVTPPGESKDLIDVDAHPASDSGTTIDVETSHLVERDAEMARRICDAVVSEVEPARVIAGVLAPVAELLGAAPVSLYLSDDESGALVLEGECDSGERSDRGELASNRGLTGSVMQTGHLVAADDPSTDARFDAEIDTPADGNHGPFLCVPLGMRGKVVGVFRAFLREDEAVSARTGEVLAAALSAAIRNVLLYRSLVDTIEDVAEARRDSRR